MLPEPSLWAPRSTFARLAGSRAPLELALDQHVERTFDEQRQLPARDRVAEKLLGSFELGIKLGARRELDEIALGRQRFELRPRR
jgi:hypothetical protein